MKDTEKESILLALGYSLRELRKAKGIKQDELAAAIGAKRSLVSMWEAGERAPKLDALIALADFYGVTVDYLLGHSDVASPEEDIQNVCFTTGLYETAVKNLIKVNQNYSRDYKPGEKATQLSETNIFEKLLECDNLSYFLMNLAYMETAAAEAGDFLQTVNKDNDLSEAFIAEDKLGHAVFRTLESVRSVLQEMYKTDQLLSLLKDATESLIVIKRAEEIEKAQPAETDDGEHQED